MRDERRRLFLRENRLEAYIEKGPGAIYLAELGDQAVCPMELVRRLAVSNPVLFRSWFVAVESVTSESLSGILDQIPVGWISDAQRGFVAELVRNTREILSGMIQ